MIRVGFDGRWLGADGVGTYTRELVIELARTELIEIEVIVRREHAQAFAGLDHIHTWTPPIPKYSMAEQTTLPRWIATRRLNLFHSPFYVVPILAPCRVVSTIHDLEAITEASVRGSRLGKAAVLWLAHAAAVAKAARVITDSPASAREIAQILPHARGKLDVVPLGVSEWWSSASLQEREGHGLFAEHQLRAAPFVVLGGKQYRKKNLPAILSAFEHYRRAGGQVQLVVVGNVEPIRVRIEEIRRSISDPGSIVTPGALVPEDLRALLRRCCALIFLSLHEGFGLPILEAMQAGAPVICSALEPMRDLAGEGALLIDPTNIAAIVGAMRDLESSIPLRHQLRARGRSRASQFTWKRCAEMTLAIYFSVLGR